MSRRPRPPRPSRAPEPVIESSRGTLEALGAAPRPALWMAAAGLLPFLFLAAAIGFAPFVWSVRALAVLINYGAVALAFVAAVHCGVALAAPGGGAGARAGWSLLPAAVGWAAVNMYPIPALVTLAAGFFIAFMLDVAATRAGLLPLWYKVLRRLFTILVLIALAAALVVIGYLR